MDSRSIAVDAVRAWESVQSRLTPVIGESGFRALFDRSLHRARVEHPWLSSVPAAVDAPFSMLTASLESQPPERAAEGSRALRDNFNELLIGLIGRALVMRLLGPT